MEHCRVSSDLRGHELSQELGIKEWIAACPSMRDVTAQEVVKMLSLREQHPLWLTAVEGPYMQTDDGLAKLDQCVRFLTTRDVLGQCDAAHHIDDFIVQLANTAIKFYFGGDETVATICEDGYRIGLLVEDIVKAALEVAYAH